MSVKDSTPRYAVSSPHKPACDMTPEEWECYKAEIDVQRAAEGQRPLDWSLIPQPLPITDEVRERVLTMNLPAE